MISARSGSAALTVRRLRTKADNRIVARRRDDFIARTFRETGCYIKSRRGGGGEGSLQVGQADLLGQHRVFGQQALVECLGVTLVGLIGAGCGAAVFDRLGHSVNQLDHQFRVLGLQIVFLRRIAFQIVQLNQWQFRIFFGVVWAGSAPAAGTGAEGEFPFATPDGERAVDGVVDGERPSPGIRLAKQRRQKRERILGGVVRKFFAVANDVVERGEQVGGADGLGGNGAGLDLGRPADEERRAVAALEYVGLVTAPIGVGLVALLDEARDLGLR